MFIKHNELRDNEKCVIVSHSDIIQALTCKGLDKERKQLIEPEKILNC